MERLNSAGMTGEEGFDLRLADRCCLMVHK